MKYAELICLIDEIEYRQLKVRDDTGHWKYKNPDRHTWYCNTEQAREEDDHMHQMITKPQLEDVLDCKIRRHLRIWEKVKL